MCRPGPKGTASSNISCMPRREISQMRAVHTVSETLGQETYAGWLTMKRRSLRFPSVRATDCCSSMQSAGDMAFLFFSLRRLAPIQHPLCIERRCRCHRGACLLRDERSGPAERDQFLPVARAGLAIQPAQADLYRTFCGV